MFVRPVQSADVDRLLELAALTSFGLTTLPRDRSLLEKRVKGSLRSFEHLEDEEPRGQSYLFVIVDERTGLVMGTSGVVSKVGGFEPFYSYRVETKEHVSKMLGVKREIRALHLVEDHNGPSEIGSLFLHPEARQGGNGRLLSLSRFLFMAEYPHLFDTEVIAEMRGVIDDQGRTPFWDAVGKHFFDLEFPKADYLSIVNKEFIGDLMPRYPIYIPILPPEAQRVIGEVHELTRPARKLLESEGFEFRNQVDIFEAGPMLHCARERIRAVRESVTAQVATTPAKVAGPEFLISTRTGGFRCVRGGVQQASNGIEIEQRAAEQLGVSSGENVRFVPLRGGK